VGDYPFFLYGSSEKNYISLNFGIIKSSKEIPFLKDNHYLIYGWASESVARLKGLKSIIVALISLLVILFMNLLLTGFMI
jgi:hypothetical protein